MCARLKADRDKVVQLPNLDAYHDAIDAAKWGELFPTDPILVVGYGFEPAVRRWGLRPDWAERPIINAKSEEAETKRTFQPLLRLRCVVPVSGYFEWRVENSRKIKTSIGANRVLPMAGFTTADSCVILTCAPSPTLAHIHHRMPAILDDDAIEHWLNPTFDFAAVSPLLKPSIRPFAIADAEPVRPAPARAEPRQASLF